MSSSLSVVALVPMRHNSLRVPGKNLRNLGGAPLYHRIVKALLACPSISQVVIDTDSDAIKSDANLTFPEVTVLDRPGHLCGDKMPMTEVLYHDATQIPGDTYLQTHSTNPFLSSETIEQAIHVWSEQRQTHDSLFAVTRLHARLWDASRSPINHNPWVLLRTQDLPPTFIENSNLYIFSSELIRATRRRIGDRPILFEMDPLEALDIDDERDFAFAEALLAVRSLLMPRRIVK